MMSVMALFTLTIMGYIVKHVVSCFVTFVGRIKEGFDLERQKLEKNTIAMIVLCYSLH